MDFKNELHTHLRGTNQFTNMEFGRRLEIWITVLSKKYLLQSLKPKYQVGSFLQKVVGMESIIFLVNQLQKTNTPFELKNEAIHIILFWASWANFQSLVGDQIESLFKKNRIWLEKQNSQDFHMMIKLRMLSNVKKKGSGNIFFDKQMRKDCMDEYSNLLWAINHKQILNNQSIINNCYTISKISQIRILLKVQQMQGQK